MQGFGGTSADVTLGVAADAAGNSVVTGYFSGTVDFGGGSLTSTGLKDVFVAKYAPDGMLLWAKKFGGSGNEHGEEVAVDRQSGDVVVTGRFTGTVDFGGGPLVSAGGDDIFVAKYSAADGSHRWSRRIGASSHDQGYGAVVDGSGNVLITGAFRQTVDFGGGPLASTLGSTDTFVAKYSAAGAHVWSRNFSGGGDDGGRAVAVDANGNVAVSGYYVGSIDLGAGFVTSYDPSTADVYVVKLTSTGTYVWSRTFGGSDRDSAGGIAVDGAGNVVVTGDFVGAVDFGGGELVANLRDVYLVKYAAADGRHLWSKRMGGWDVDEGKDLGLDSNGNIFVTGAFLTTANFGGTDLVSAGSSDVFLAKYAASGTHLWSKGFGGTSAEQGNDVAVQGNGNSFATGAFQASADFDSQVLTSTGSYDVFLLSSAP